MDHLLGSPSLDTGNTTDTIGYSSGPLLRPAVSADLGLEIDLIQLFPIIRRMRNLISENCRASRRKSLT